MPNVFIKLYIPISFINENIFDGTAVSKGSFQLLTRKNLKHIMSLSVQSKRVLLARKTEASPHL